MQAGYCDHVWVVEASRKYRAQRLCPDATTVAPVENAFFAEVVKSMQAVHRDLQGTVESGRV